MHEQFPNEEPTSPHSEEQEIEIEIGCKHTDNELLCFCYSCHQKLCPDCFSKHIQSSESHRVADQQSMIQIIGDLKLKMSLDKNEMIEKGYDKGSKGSSGNERLKELIEQEREYGRYLKELKEGDKLWVTVGIKNYLPLAEDIGFGDTSFRDNLEKGELLQESEYEVKSKSLWGCWKYATVLLVFLVILIFFVYFYTRHQLSIVRIQRKKTNNQYRNIIDTLNAQIVESRKYIQYLQNEGKIRQITLNNVQIERDDLYLQLNMPTDLAVAQSKLSAVVELFNIVPRHSFLNMIEQVRAGLCQQCHLGSGEQNCSVEESSTEPKNFLVADSIKFGTGSEDGSINLWAKNEGIYYHLSTLHPPKPLRTTPSGNLGSQYAPIKGLLMCRYIYESPKLYGWGNSNLVYSWNLVQLREEEVFGEHTDWVTGVVMMENGQIYSSGLDGNLFLWGTNQTIHLQYPIISMQILKGEYIALLDYSSQITILYPNFTLLSNGTMDTQVQFNSKIYDIGFPNQIAVVTQTTLVTYDINNEHFINNPLISVKPGKHIQASFLSKDKKMINMYLADEQKLVTINLMDGKVDKEKQLEETDITTMTELNDGTDILLAGRSKKITRMYKGLQFEQFEHMHTDWVNAIAHY